MIFKNIIEKLENINGVSTSYSESWTHLSYEGVYNSKYSSSFFSDLYGAFVSQNIENAIIFYIDDERVSSSDFIEELNNGSKWGIHINKTNWLNKFDTTNICHTFFIIKTVL